VRIRTAALHWLRDIGRFSHLVLEKPLRPYQLEPARAILASIFEGQGLTFAVMMSRQAGKNELSGQLEAYLLNVYQRRGGQIVKASPTYQPQTINSVIRLSDRLDNDWNAGHWRRRENHMIQLGKARAYFFSAGPRANVVGATADLLLEADEAQDIAEEKWYKDFSPMAASTNATTVFYGTAWTSATLLARTIADLENAQRRDGRRRVFCYDAGQVGECVPNYAAYVAKQVRRLGRNHPLIKTQYFLETIDAQGGLFNELRRALMRGDHLRRHEPEAGHRYALLVDVAGEEETEGEPLERLMLENPKRDATALTVVDVEAHPGGLPDYRAVDRKLWLGVKHASLYSQIVALARHWHAVWILVDATGIGAGLASFLALALGERVIPVVFSEKVKSDLGWGFVGIVETGRYRDYVADETQETRQFWHEVERCQYQIRPGASRSLKWGVWDTPAYDGVIAHGHDDLLISASLCALLDLQPWPTTGDSVVVQRPDVLDDIDSARW
jgi:hypothetical protein